MTKFVNHISLAAVLAGSVLASAATADVSATTCGDFARMDDAARLTFAHEILTWINDTANYAVAGPALTGRYDVMAKDDELGPEDVLTGKPDAAWTHQEMKLEIEGHCINMPADTNIIQRLRDHT